MYTLTKIKKLIAGYRTSEQSGILSWILDYVVSMITGYNHKKYWRRRSYVIEPTKKNVLLKAYYIYYLKRVDAKHMSSSGFMYNAGAIVVGDITIGDNVQIDANSVVCKSVPDNCVDAGNPTKIIRQNGLRINKFLT